MVAIAQKIVVPIKNLQKLMPKMGWTGSTLRASDTGELSLTLHCVTSNQRVVNALLDSIPSREKENLLSLANGAVRNAQVVAITPSQVVLMVTNTQDTTAPIRTRSTTNLATYTVSATPVTTGGTARTTRITTRTSRSSTKTKANSKD